MWSGQRNAWSSSRTSAAGWTRLTFLAMQTAVPAGHTTQLLAALLGTNIGPMILLWDHWPLCCGGNVAAPADNTYQL